MSLKSNRRPAEDYLPGTRWTWQDSPLAGRGTAEAEHWSACEHMENSRVWGKSHLKDEKEQAPGDFAIPRCQLEHVEGFLAQGKAGMRLSLALRPPSEA